MLNKKQSNKLNDYFEKLKSSSNGYAKEIYKLAKESGVLDEAQNLLEEYKRKALDVLGKLESSSVKILLFRLLNKIIGGK